MNKFSFISVFFAAIFILSAAVGFSQPVFTTTHLDACNASANGSITINVSSATGPTSYNIISGSFNVGPITFTSPVTISGLAGTVAGRTYFVVVSDDNGSTPTTVVVTLYSNVSGTTSATGVTTCSPFNGAIDLTPSGGAAGSGSGSYSYAWTGPSSFTATTQDISGVGPGDYNVTISDANTVCTAVLGPINVSIASPSITLGSIPGVCSGTTTSTLPYSATTGSPNEYTIDWDNTANGAGLADVAFTALPATPISITGIPSVGSTTTFNGTLVARNSGTGCVTAANSISVTVTANVTPSVSVGASPSGPICAGTSVTFTATPTNGGTPTYQWRKNGSNVGTNSNTYTDAALANGDQVDVVMTSSITCVTTPTATSTAITMTVTTPVTPSVTVAASPSGPICVGTSVTFTATPTNGGTPTYQWRKNGSNVGTNSNTYTDATLANGDQVDVVMTTSLTCVTTPTATSTAITMTVTAPVTPSVSIAASPSGPICASTSVTFTATPTNGGTPAYQWRKNGSNVGTNSNIYTDAGLANGDQIDVVMTTSLTCVTTPTATSTAITMTVTAPVTPSVTIAASPNGTICGGTSVTFTATPTNGGTPSYQWRKNGSNVGTNSNTYTDATLANGDQIDVVMTSSISCVTTPTANSNTITMTVTTPVVPSVSIAASPSGPICAGTSVTFTATPTNGGTPTYQWRKNGSNVGSNSNTYTDAALANGDQIDVVMTTSLTCVTTPTANSNTITMTVTTPLVPSVNIAASPNGAICSGTSVTFTATPTNGGTPTYQWKKNGSNVGTNSNTYTDAALANGDQIDVVMTTSLTCVTTPTATSNTVTMTVNASVTPLVSIVASPSGAICAGSSVTFTATPTSGGTPTYQWRKNGSNVGTSSSTYTDAALANGDQIDVVMTTSLACATTPTATSNLITMTVNNPVAPLVSIAASPNGTICGGTSVTFTATPTNGGGAPTYQWKKNGSNVGTNSNTYTDATLANGDQIDVVMTTSLSCVTTPTANSNTITMTVTTPLVPSVSVVASPSGAICSGTSVTFTATPTNGGTPAYQWRKNGVNVGTNSNAYTDAALANGDQIDVVMTTSLTCVTSPTATSSAITMTVSTSLTPSVSIAASPAGPICLGTSVTFTATPTNGGTPTYQWTKNGSNVGTNSNTYTDASLTNGDQVNVIMTSSLTCATTPTATTTPITMTVNNPVVPSVSVTASPSGAICAGTSVTFTAAPTNGGTPTYQWRKNGSNVGTNSNTYTDAALANGDQVDVVMTTSLTCVTTPTATSAAITMTVNPLPTATISYSGGPFCATGTVSVTQTGQTGGTYSSSPSGLSIDGTTGQINLAASTGGIYTVTYTFTDGTCPNTTTTGVTVNALPTATISYSGNPFCATGTGNVTQTGQAGGTYSSTGGLVINASTGQIDLVASAPGPYTITYSFTNGTCPNTTTASVTINPLPTAPTGGDVTVCFDNSLHTGTATPGAGESIVWYTAASGGSITVAPSGTAAGTYSAFAAAKNNATNCESATRTQVTVTINALPTITFTAGASTICAGNSSTYTTQAGQNNYVWNVTGGTITSGGAPTDNTATIQWTNSGSVTVNYTDGNTCTAATPTSRSVTVSATPTVAAAGGDQSNVCGTASLSGNTPTTGTGSWGFAPAGNVDGLGNIVTPSSPTSGFNGTPGQSYTLRWTISNGTCTPSTDDVVIAFDPTGVTPSAAGPDQSNCNNGAFTLAGNVPTSGTGQWTIVGSANGAAITAPATNNSTVTGLTLGQSVTLRWSITNGASCTSTDDVVLSNNNNPTVASAGSDQEACGTSVTLAANTPTVGTGAWSIVTGTGGSFVDATNPASVFNGTQGNVYKLRWTISNGACAPSTADVNITLDQTPTTAAAGPDILNACGTIALSANNPSVGVGSWSITTNPDNLGSVANASSNVSNFNGSPNVTYVLRWTISNGVCANSTDDVTIQYSPTGPSTANAGPDQTTICGTSATLSGNVPAVGTGQWNFASGGNPDGLGIIADINNQASGFSGTAGVSYTLVWTVTNGTCTSTDQVVIKFNAAPTASNAGPDQSLCATNTTLAANAPTTGTGIWSFSSNPDGLGVIADVNNRLSGFTGTIGQVYILTWTITSGGCTPSQDDVKISLNACGGVCSVPVISKVDACAGNDGQINFTSVSGGTGPYSFSIDNGATWTTPPSPSYSFTGLAGGTYSTLVKDAANCTSTVNTIVIAYKITATVAKTDVTSCVASDGKITIVGQGGAGYVYSLNGGANSAPFSSTTTITGLAAGTYSVVIQDTGGSGCTSAPTSITVSGCTIPPATNCGAFTITATDTRPTCAGQDDGTITIVISGGAPNYVVTLADPALGFSQAMTGPGPFSFGTGPSGGLSPSLNYQYTVTDNASNTCTLPYSLPIQSNVKATASGFVDAQCYNQAVGQATLTVTSGGTSPYEYSLDAGATWVSFTSPATINNLMPAAAPYAILVRDGATDQCPAQVSVTIGNAAADILISSTTSDASCVNNDGSIQITSVSGGNAPYTYQFNGASTSSLSFGTLAAGNYTFAVTDALGCAKNFPFTISSPGYADFTTQVTGPSCLGGGADGKIDVQINTSGNFDIGITADPNNDPSPFQFLSRSNISTPVSFTGLSQGTYRVVVKPNGALCSTPQTVVISTGPAAVDFDLKAMDFYCFETKGTVKIFNIKGSTSVDYTYEIVNLGTIVRTGGVTQLQTLDTVTLPLPQVGLDKGNYQVRLFQDQSAATGCSTPISSAFKNFSIDGPTLISFDTLSVVRLQSQYSLATGSMSITLDNTFAPRYQWMLKLIAPDITGQTNSHNDFDSQWIMPSTSIGPVTFEAQNLYAGSYQLSIRDSIGCLRTYPLSINLDAEIFIPNIFTPNNDSKNDNFEILYLPPNSKITITNRWGKQVLSGSSFPLATDGITSIVWNGGTESDGVYFYTLDTPKKTYTGWVELKR